MKDFEGCYYLNVDEKTVNKDGSMNPKVLELYLDENGILEGYRGYYYPMTGTSEIYIYDSFQINGDTLICKYSSIRNYGEIRSEKGEHRFQLTQDGNLIEDQENWFRNSRS